MMETALLVQQVRVKNIINQTAVIQDILLLTEVIVSQTIVTFNMVRGSMLREIALPVRQKNLTRAENSVKVLQYAVSVYLLTTVPLNVLKFTEHQTNVMLDVYLFVINLELHQIAL